WHEFFTDFRPAFGLISARATTAQVRFLVRHLNLTPRKSFLDCPCGIGRIALPLAAKGVRVTGVDFMQDYIDEMQRTAQRRGLKIRGVVRDMRRIEFEDEFDAAGNLWTSFGFFARESDNMLVLRRVFRALKPGGRFVLHVINRDWIMANYTPSDWFEARGVKILEKRSFDYATSTSWSTWTFLKDGEKSSHEVHIRMYSFHELIAMFRNVGFVDIEGYGSTNDAPISHTSQMMFVIGRKPR
ncbi:MAG TPA: methyltransferase domain-containing protein, partial [Acidobacteriota bacterium]|nr:methyltransferase domain-containing protein [Acidobacteriota bacterium]